MSGWRISIPCGGRGIGGEVLQIERDQRVRVVVHGGGEHVTVLGVAGHLVDQVLEPVDEGLGAEGGPHVADPTCGPGWVDAELEKVALDLVEDLIRPQRLEQTGLGEPQQRRREPDRDQHTRVEDGGRATHRVLITRSAGVSSVTS